MAVWKLTAEDEAEDNSVDLQLARWIFFMGVVIMAAVALALLWKRKASSLGSRGL